MTLDGVTTRIDTRILKGGPLRDQLLPEVARVIAALGVRIRVCIVQVGDNPASNAYITHKLAACARVGVTAEVVRLSETDGESALHATVHALAQDSEIHAIIVQTPLPDGWRVQAVLDLVPAAKDIDGLSAASASLRRANSEAALLPATPLGVLRLLDVAGAPVAGSRIAVIGKGMVVGAPLREMLAQAGAEVVAIDKDTPAPAKLARSCDVLVAAAGAPGLVTDAWVKPGAVVIDVGLTRTGGQLLGDVARVRVEGIARVLTPVPGGVGPMTVASLLTNIADAACLQLGRPRTVWEIDAEA